MKKILFTALLLVYFIAGYSQNVPYYKPSFNTEKIIFKSDFERGSLLEGKADNKNARSGISALRVRNEEKVLFNMSVKKGDMVSFSVFAKYHGNNEAENKLPSLLLKSNINNFPIRSFSEKQLSNHISPFFAIIAHASTIIKAIHNNKIPNASLEAYVYDTKHELIEIKSIALTKSGNNKWENLILNAPLINRDGSIELYVKNKSTKQVWVDDLSVKMKNDISENQNKITNGFNISRLDNNIVSKDTAKNIKPVLPTVKSTPVMAPMTRLPVVLPPADSGGDPSAGGDDGAGDGQPREKGIEPIKSKDLPTTPSTPPGSVDPNTPVNIPPVSVPTSPASPGSGAGPVLPSVDGGSGGSGSGGGGGSSGGGSSGGGNSGTGTSDNSGYTPPPSNPVAGDKYIYRYYEITIHYIYNCDGSVCNWYTTGGSITKDAVRYYENGNRFPKDPTDGQVVYVPEENLIFTYDASKKKWNGVSAPIRDITNNLKNPCLQSAYTLVNNLGFQSTLTAAIQEVFGGSNNIYINLIFEDDNTLPNNISGKTFPSNHIVDKGVVESATMEVSLNVNTLPQGSIEPIVETILHESLHAYFDARDTTMMKELAQHQDIANSYMEWEIEAMQKIFPNMAINDIVSIMISGFGDIQANDPTLFTQILSKYNLTLNEVTTISNTYKNGTKGTKCK